MSEVDIEHLRTWIGRERTVEDIITPRLASSLDAVLDRDHAAVSGAPAPVGIHWCLAPDIVPMRGIGADGHPARGGFLPPVPFPRRMWAGGELTFSGSFLVGDSVAKRSVIEDVALKSGRSGDMIFVTLRHHYETPRGLALTERQDVVYRQLAPAGLTTDPAPSDEPFEHRRAIDAGPVLLFRYSAITFNGHRIHYDQPYVTGEENYPGLIFHGPLQATLLLALAEELSGGRVPAGFSFRSVHPLFAGGTPHVHARRQNDGLALWLTDTAGVVTMKGVTDARD
ncbi:MAG: MaoC family dehydratase N-terminal domain-containing protein [Rhizobium sp.]|nr:MaoC family dehydratase N-terminal domain-containing protein [Rhizobium sp.]MBX9456450.1 MaoC family dehydratase N-terminal domain-containing protein [Rhizobium sp.]